MGEKLRPVDRADDEPHIFGCGREGLRSFGPRGCCRLFVTFPAHIADPMHEALQILRVARAATEDGFNRAVEPPP